MPAASADQADDTAVTDPVFDKPEQPIVADRVDEPGNVGVQNPVHRVVIDPGELQVNYGDMIPIALIPGITVTWRN